MNTARQRFINQAATTGASLRGVPGVNQYHASTGTCCLVGDELHQLKPSGVSLWRDRTQVLVIRRGNLLCYQERCCNLCRATHGTSPLRGRGRDVIVSCILILGFGKRGFGIVRRRLLRVPQRLLCKRNSRISWLVPLLNTMREGIFRLCALFFDAHRCSEDARLATSDDIHGWLRGWLLDIETGALGIVRGWLLATLAFVRGFVLYSPLHRLDCIPCGFVRLCRAYFKYITILKELQTYRRYFSLNIKNYFKERLISPLLKQGVLRRNVITIFFIFIIKV